MVRLNLIPRRPTGRVVVRGGLITSTLLKLGPELNPDPFFDDPGLWALGEGWSIDQNTAKVSGIQTGNVHCQLQNILEPQTLYQVECTLPVINAGRMRQGAGSGEFGAWQTEPVFNLIEVMNTLDGVLHLRVTGDTDAIGDCTFLSVREVLVR